MKLTREQIIIAIGYAVFMILFYFIGITGARALEFLAIVILTGFYALGVYWVKKIGAK
jgi:hypothetical protein